MGPGVKLKIIENPNRNFKRGDIYYADLNSSEQPVGCEQMGKRPVLIIQNDIGNFYSPTTIVAILTTKRKKNMPTHVQISDGLPMTSIVCLEQIKTIDKSRLGDYVGNIGTEKMKEIESAIFVSLGVKKSVEYEKALVLDEYEEDCDVQLLKRETEFDKIKMNWMQLAEQQLMFFSEIKQYMINLKIVQINTEKEIEEILEYIEMKNCNAAQGYKIYKVLKERRQQRKQIIMELKQLKSLTEEFDCEQMKKLYQNAISVMQKIEHEEKCKSNIMELLEQEVC